MSKPNRASRRTFIGNTLKGTAGVLAGLHLPMIVPSTVFGRNAPSNRINIGAIGVGRISRGHDLPNLWKHEKARILAVCDVDRKRLGEGKALVDGHYAKKTGKPYRATKTYDDYRELIADKDIDAVVISTPDHWHVLQAMHALRAGKDIYMQKPASLTISEGRILSDEVRRTGRILQIGSQQRSMPQFRKACELVRNGRIGALKEIYIGLPIDDPGESTREVEMPVPANLDYDRWLGPTPQVYYTEKRVHPQQGYSRPGWLRCEQFGAGMITGWGSHHFDIMNWGMDTEGTGPVEVFARAEFPAPGLLWDVHGPYNVELKYENGVKVFVSDKYPNGVRFVGSEGWIFVTRGDYTATANDPVSGTGTRPLEASDPRILSSQIGPSETKLYVSEDQHGNFLDCVISREQPISHIEAGHRACSVCLVSHIAMKLGRKLYWDPVQERFRNDDEANSFLTRPQRAPYVL